MSAKSSNDYVTEVGCSAQQDRFEVRFKTIDTKLESLSKRIWIILILLAGGTLPSVKEVAPKIIDGIIGAFLNTPIAIMVTQLMHVVEILRL